MRLRILHDEQEEFLLKCVKLIEQVFESGTQTIYQWDLQKEKIFVYKVLYDGGYDKLEDADRLNSIRNLYGYLKKGITTSN